MRPNGLDDQPTFKVAIDREKASALGVSLSDIDQSFSITWGSRYVNNFLDTDGRIKRVFVQADAPFRMNPEDLRLLYVRNANGTMVPFSSFATGQWTYGSPKLERYNGVSSFEIQGQAAPGHSTGQAIAAMERLARQLPEGVGYEWTGLSLQEQLSGSQAPLLFALSLAGGFPEPRGAVRELVDSDLGHHGRAARGARRARAQRPGSACRTTSTSRWACSRRSACRRRTRS